MFDACIVGMFALVEGLGEGCLPALTRGGVFDLVEWEEVEEGEYVDGSLLLLLEVGGLLGLVKDSTGIDEAKMISVRAERARSRKMAI